MNLFNGVYFTEAMQQLRRGRGKGQSNSQQPTNLNGSCLSETANQWSGLPVSSSSAKSRTSSSTRSIESALSCQDIIASDKDSGRPVHAVHVSAEDVVERFIQYLQNLMNVSSDRNKFHASVAWTDFLRQNPLYKGVVKGPGKLCGMFPTRLKLIDNFVYPTVPVSGYPKMTSGVSKTSDSVTNLSKTLSAGPSTITTKPSPATPEEAAYYFQQYLLAIPKNTDKKKYNSGFVWNDFIKRYPQYKGVVKGPGELCIKYPSKLRLVDSHYIYPVIEGSPPSSVIGVSNWLKEAVEYWSLEILKHNLISGSPLSFEDFWKMFPSYRKNLSAVTTGMSARMCLKLLWQTLRKDSRLVITENEVGGSSAAMLDKLSQQCGVDKVMIVGAAQRLRSYLLTCSMGRIRIRDIRNADIYAREPQSRYLWDRPKALCVCCPSYLRWGTIDNEVEYIYPVGGQLDSNANEKAIVSDQNSSSLAYQSPPTKKQEELLENFMLYLRSISDNNVEPKFLASVVWTGFLHQYPQYKGVVKGPGKLCKMFPLKLRIDNNYINPTVGSQQPTTTESKRNKSEALKSILKANNDLNINNCNDSNCNMNLLNKMSIKKDISSIASMQEPSSPNPTTPSTIVEEVAEEFRIYLRSRSTYGSVKKFNATLAWDHFIQKFPQYEGVVKGPEELCLKFPSKLKLDGNYVYPIVGSPAPTTTSGTNLTRSDTLKSILKKNSDYKNSDDCNGNMNVLNSMKCNVDGRSTFSMQAPSNSIPTTPSTTVEEVAEEFRIYLRSRSTYGSVKKFNATLAWDHFIQKFPQYEGVVKGPEELCLKFPSKLKLDGNYVYPIVGSPAPTTTSGTNLTRSDTLKSILKKNSDYKNSDDCNGNMNVLNSMKCNVDGRSTFSMQAPSSSIPTTPSTTLEQVAEKFLLYLLSRSSSGYVKKLSASSAWNDFIQRYPQYERLVKGPEELCQRFPSKLKLDDDNVYPLLDNSSQTTVNHSKIFAGVLDRADEKIISHAKKRTDSTNSGSSKLNQMRSQSVSTPSASSNVSIVPSIQASRMEDTVSLLPQVEDKKKANSRFAWYDLFQWFPLDPNPEEKHYDYQSLGPSANLDPWSILEQGRNSYTDPLLDSSSVTSKSHSKVKVGARDKAGTKIRDITNSSKYYRRHDDAIFDKSRHYKYRCVNKSNIGNNNNKRVTNCSIGVKVIITIIIISIIIMTTTIFKCWKWIAFVKSFLFS